jgi:hypothetical protein
MSRIEGCHHGILVSIPLRYLILDNALADSTRTVQGKANLNLGNNITLEAFDTIALALSLDISHFDHKQIRTLLLFEKAILKIHREEHPAKRRLAILTFKRRLPVINCIVAVT